MDPSWITPVVSPRWPEWAQEVIERADVLDSAGNTAKAITKGFSISAAALTVLALFAAYTEVMAAHGVNITISLTSPMVIAGVLLGAITPPLFSALLMLAVTHNAFDMIEEIRRQFREHPGILAGTEDPGLCPGRQHRRDWSIDILDTASLPGCWSASHRWLRT